MVEEASSLSLYNKQPIYRLNRRQRELNSTSNSVGMKSHIFGWPLSKAYLRSSMLRSVKLQSILTLNSDQEHKTMVTKKRILMVNPFQLNHIKLWFQPLRIPVKQLKSWCWTLNCFSHESATLKSDTSLSWSRPRLPEIHTFPCIL